jgi:hypothetical protein
VGIRARLPSSDEGSKFEGLSKNRGIRASPELFGMTAALGFEKSGDFLISPLFPRL